MGAIVSSQKKFLQRHNKSPKKGQIKQKKRSRYLANEKQEHSETQEQVLEAATTTTATSNASATQGSKRNDKRRRNSNHGHNSLRRSKHDDKQLEQLPQLVSTISILPRSAWANNFRFRVDEFQCCIDDKETALVEKSSVLKYKTPHFRASARVEVPPVSEGKQLVVGWIQVVRSMTFVNLYGDLGITSWEFPEMATGKQRMISDSDGHRYPWYGARKEVASVRGPKTSPTIVSVSMNDNFSPQVTWHIPAPNPKKASRDPRLTRVYRQQAFTTCLAIMEVSDSGDRDDCYSSNAALGERLLDAGVAQLTSTSQVSMPGTFSTTRFTNNNNNIPQATTIFTTRENGAVTSFRAFTTSAQTTTTTTTTTTATPRLQPQQQHHINSVKKNGQQQQHHLNFKHIVACSSQSDQLKKSQPSLLQSQTSLHQQRKQLKGVCSSEPKLFSRCEQDTSYSNNCINYSTTTTTNQKQRRLHIFNKQPFNRTNDALTPIKRQQQQFSQPQQLQQRHRQDLLENLKTKPVTSSTTKTFTSHSDNWVNTSSSQTSSSSSSSTSSSSSSSPPLQTPSSSSPLQASSLSSPSQMMILKAVDWCMEIEIAVDPSQPIGNRARLINRASSRFSKPEPIEDDERLNHIIDSSALFPPNANRSQVLVWRPFQEVTSQNGEVTCHATPPLSPVASPSLSTPSSSLSSSMTVLAVSSVVPTPSHYLQCNHHHNSSGSDKPTLFSMAQNSLSSPQPLSSSSSSSSSTFVQSISSFSLKPSSSSSSSYSSPLSSSTSTSLPLSPPSSSSSSSLPPSSSSSSLSLTFPPTIVVKPNHTTVDMTQYFQLTTHLRESLFESVVV